MSNDLSIIRVDFYIPKDDPAHNLTFLRNEIQKNLFDEADDGGPNATFDIIGRVDMDDEKRRLVDCNAPVYVPCNAKRLIEAEKPKRFHVEGLETSSPDSNYLPEGMHPPYIIHDCEAGEPLPMSFRSRIEALNFAQHLNDNPLYFAPGAYRFTSKNTDADLDGTPAVIYQIDGYGNYELRYICGSTLVVFPPNVVTL